MAISRIPSFRFLCIFCFGMLLTACSDNDATPGSSRPAGNPADNAPAVEAVVAVLSTLPLEERVTGRVIARNQTEIYPEVAGTITDIFVENGDQVNAGDPLLQLRNAEFSERYQQALSGLEIARAQTQQARANLELVQSQVRRTESLVERNLENNVNLETVKSELAIAQADLDLRLAQEKQASSLADERKIQLENATIRSPIKGTVGQRNAEIGQLATTSSRLFLVGELTEMRIELMLSDRMLEYIDVGVPVNIFSLSWEEERVLQSEISRISPFLDTTTMRTQAFVELPNSDNLLRPGMFVTVDILYGESEEAVVVPNSALSRHPRTGIEGIYTFAREENTASGENLQNPEGTGVIGSPREVNFVPVDIVATGRMSSAVNGIEEGDLVVTIGQHLLEGGIQTARPRILPWDNMMTLQQTQSEDMFRVIDERSSGSNLP